MIDSHCHFDFEAFEGARKSLLAECIEHGVSSLIMPGVSPDQWQTLLSVQQLQTDFCRLYIAAGLHPWWVESTTLNPSEFKQCLQSFVLDHSVVAIGECGLDGKINLSLDLQQAFFRAQVEVAMEFNLPLIVHAYGAHNAVMQTLAYYRPTAGGVIHGFSGSPELAQQYWRLGFYLGVGGTITYDRAAKTRRAVKSLPLEALLLETDAPDMPLQGMQGKVNTPLNVAAVARDLAALRDEPLTLIQQQTVENTKTLFRL